MIVGRERGAGDIGRKAAPRNRFARVKAVFCNAIERPAGSRAAYVATACAGDDELLREVESLLASDGQADGFIEVPAAAVLGAEVAGPRPSGSPQPQRPPQLPAGTRLGAYVIEAPIGSGGMGEVYRARDTRLRRTVAIKIVCGDQSDERAQGRLLREARHASVLNHPCICTIHEVGAAADGRPFIVMEQVAGETLREAVSRCGGLPPALVLRYGADVAAALDHAHGRGVMHRDLKSTNVMVAADSDRVKVLDFGLACRLPQSALPASTSFATDPLALAGTLNYMAPEVLLGAAADARSDLWSLGVLLFEMCTGDLPFSGRTPFETASAILHTESPPLPPGVPVGLRLVIGRCLAREPGKRYQRAADVLAALEALRGRGRRRLVARLLLARIRSAAMTRAALVVAAAIVLTGGVWWIQQAGGAASPIQTVAVLPLQNGSGADAERYFADGLTEALISEIGETGVERVISRTTAMKFRDGRRSVTEIARQLGVDVIVEGSVSRFADRVQLSARLRDGRTGGLLWSTSQVRTTREVLALVSQVAKGWPSAMRHSMTGDARIRLATVRAVDPAVYEAYLKGRYAWNERTGDSLERAVEYYREAIRLDASYAPAHAALADCYNQLGTVMVGTGSPGGFRPLARASAIRALQIDPNLAEAHATLGYIEHYEWEWADAEHQFLRAIRLNPSNALAHIWYANLLSSRRRFPEAIREVQVAQDLDPFSLVVNTNVAWTLGYAGREEEAIDQLHHALEMDPNYVQAHLRLAGALKRTGRYDEAIRESRIAVQLTGESPSSLSALAEVCARAGRSAEARALLDRLLEESKRRYVSPAAIAGIYEQLGDVDEAFAWLEKAYREHSNYIAYLAADRHTLLRPDPRFAALLLRVGLEQVR